LVLRIVSKAWTAAGAESLPESPFFYLPTFTLLGPGLAESRMTGSPECSPAGKEWQPKLKQLCSESQLNVARELR